MKKKAKITKKITKEKAFKGKALVIIKKKAVKIEEKPNKTVSKEKPKKIAVVKKKIAVVKKTDIIVQPVVKPPEVKLKPPVAQPVKPVLRSPERSEGNKPVVVSPAPVKEGNFEVFIPKYKVKQKLRPHHTYQPEVKQEIKHESIVSAAVQQEVVAFKDLEVIFPISVKDLAFKMSAKPNDIIARLMKKGILVTINHYLDEESAGLIAREFNFKLLKALTKEEEVLKEHKEKEKTNLVSRSPVVTFMGHVDHGKTSLLDAIRKSNVTEREAGGITQHIGAYRVETPKGAITFLDTPGHEAFTAMRARGAIATDIVILVVAADDGVMPQTKEAIDHAKAAGVSIVVALNKIDKPTADIDRVKKQLNQLDLRSEDWGGKTIMVGVSAKTKQGVDTLLEMIILEAEMLELKANIEKTASGVVIEGRLSKGKGPVATVLVKSGTLKNGQNIIIGNYYGKIRAMINDKGERLEEALPSIPVEISGLSGVPEAGEQFYVIDDEKKVKEIFQEKQLSLRRQNIAPVTKKITLEDIYTQIKEGKIKELNIILKADVQGSLEALKDSLTKISTSEVKLDIIHSDVGVINDADIILAAASNAIVIGFNAGVSPQADERIKEEGVDVRLYRIIYDIISDVKSAMEGLLEPKIEEVFEGRALVKQVFSVSKAGTIAGCIVQKGTIGRADSCKLIRDGKEIYNGKINSLKRFKDDAKEVKEGFECGIALADFKDLRAGDIIEAFIIRKTARKL